MKLLLTFFVCFVSLWCVAQDTTGKPGCTFPDTYAGYGSIDFTGEQYGYRLLTDVSGNAKKISYGANPNVTDVNYVPQYNTNGVATDEICNDSIVTATNCNFDPNTLTYIVYYPTVQGSSTDVRTCKFPAIILFPSGGFADCNGNNPKEDIADIHILNVMAQEFAKRGYVAFIAEYRTGRYVAPPFAPHQYFLTAQQSLAEYRAFQDARGAIRSIIKHQKVHNQGTGFTDDPYQIDLTKIFIGGNSAGSIMAIQTAYYDATQIAAIFPTAGTITAVQALGAIDIDNYYGKVSDAPDLRVTIKGVLDMWGQAIFPASYANNLSAFWANNPSIPPVIAFHGKMDETLPINTTNVIFAPDKTVTVAGKQIDYTPYNSESHCLLAGPYILDDNITGPNGIDLIGAGSYGIYNIFKTVGFNKSIELYVDCNMTHGINTINDNFGLTGVTSTDQIYTYMVQRATTFFQAAITGQDTNLGNDLFIECVSQRVKSYVSTLPHNAPVTTDNPATCTQKCTLP